MGWIAVSTYEKHNNYNYKFAISTDSETFGFYIASLVGIDYVSPDSHFKISTLLPMLFDINLGDSSRTKLGINDKGISETCKIHDNGFRVTYLETHNY